MEKKKKKPSIKGPLTVKMRTICEVHRDIYDIVYDMEIKNKENLIALLEEAFFIGRETARELFHYKGSNKEEFYKAMEYEHNLDYLYKKKMRKKRENKK